MPISDLFGLLAKRQTTPDKYLASSVNVMGAGQNGALRSPFSQSRGIQSYRSWVYAAATINANAVAALPLRLYAKKDATPLPTRAIGRLRKSYLSGDLAGDQRPSPSVMRKAVAYGDDFEEVTGSHPITDLLATGNPFLNGFDLSVLRVLYGELTGNAYIHPVIDEASGLPAELWPLAPQYVEVIPDEDEFISGYLYGIDSSRKQVFERDEVIHFRRPNPANLYYGLGKVEAAYGVIQANEAIHQMDLSTFENSARPDYAVVVKGNATGDQLDRFQNQVERRLRGTRKDGNFVTVTGDVQFTPLNFPPKDIGGREEIVEEIAAVFGVPVSMLKANDPNLASSQTGFAQWREGTILPLCRMDEEELNQTLLPLFGLEDTHCLAYDNPVPADKAYELQERQTAVAGGWRTPNEARIEEGREPIEDEFADRLLVNGQPIGGMGGGLGGLLSLDSTDSAGSDGEDGPDLGFASSLLQSLRERRLTDYTVVKMLQGCGFARAVAERMVDAEVKAIAAEDAAKRDKIHRMPDEPFDDCVERGVEVLTAEGYDQDQAVAMAHSMCEGTKAIADVDLKPTEQMAALAERGLKLREEHGRGGTEVGVARARDIKNRADLSPETVGRMANFFSRHRVDLDAPAADPDHEDYPSAGVIAWLLWGGDPANPDAAGAGWADRKMDELEAAEEKNGDASTPAKPGERIEGSDENPEGSASGSRGGIEISEAQEAALEKKRDEHNEKHGDDPGKKVDLGMLKAVYRRGAGAFSTSHRPGMTRQQWAMARVNSFLYLVRNGKPESAKYTSDNDLLPKDHPKYESKEDKGCDCCSTVEKAAKVYEWPDETKWYRLAIEGLEDDYERLRPKAAADEPDADDDIREGENETPAMAIRSIVEDGLRQVQKRLEQALKSGEISPVPQKANGREKAIREILEDLTGLKGPMVENLVAALTGAARGGGSAGASRINEILSAAGAGRISTPAISAALEKAIATQAASIVEAVITETVQRFDSGLGQTFSIDEEIRRLRTSYGLSRDRATVIARTESATAYHEGQVDAWKESGAVKEKHFMIAPGACEFCQAIAKRYGPGKKALPISDSMVKAGETIKGSAGGSFKVGRSSLGIVHPNCRCDVQPVIEEF